VSSAFERSVATLRAAGAIIVEADAPSLDAAHSLFEGGGFAGAESAQIHRPILATQRELYDPNVAARIEMGESLKGADYVQLGMDRSKVIQQSAELLRDFDAMLLPSTATIAPTIAQVSASADEYKHWNLLMLRNTGLMNMLDGCAVSLPMHRHGEPPAGLMVAGMGGTDQRILAVSRAIEGALAADTGGESGAPPGKRPRAA
jgi:aspartyl-tRNA(Asn)/glutamyl-tRNA(Gln) amidotransferase subunit A